MDIEVKRATSEDFELYQKMYTELCEAQEPTEYGESVSSSVLIRDKVSTWFTEDGICHPYILFKDGEPIGIAIMHLRTERAVI